MQTEKNKQEEIYNLYYNKVFGYVMNRVQNRANAEDITSEIFLKLISKSEEFDLKKPGASTYIFRVMQTTLTDFYRKNKMVYASLEEIADEVGETEDMDAELEILNRALDVLSEREVAIVILHYYHGLSHKEIAGKMHLSYTNVRQLCHVALKKLRKEMEKTI